MEIATKRGARLTVDECMKHLPTAAQQWFIEVFRHAALDVELYSPRGTDQQTPHARDEIYVVVEGSGQFLLGEDHVPFGAGDFFFVPAGMPHRFEDFGEQMTTWVIFFGHPQT